MTRTMSNWYPDLKYFSRIVLFYVTAKNLKNRFGRVRPSINYFLLYVLTPAAFTPER